MNGSVDDHDINGHSSENRKRNRALKHDNSGSSVTMYPPKRTIALESPSLLSVEGDEKDTVEALYSLSQSCEMLPSTPTGPLSKMKKMSSDAELKANQLIDPSPERLAYLMDLNASGRINQVEKDELFNLLVKRATIPDPPAVPVLERKRSYSSDSMKAMAAPVGLPRSREGSLNGLAAKASSPQHNSSFTAKNTYVNKAPDPKGQRPSLRKYEKLQTIVSGVELESGDHRPLIPENLKASVDVNDLAALKGLSLSIASTGSVHFDAGSNQVPQQTVSRESSGSSTNSSSGSSGSKGRKPRSSKSKSTSNAAIPYEFGDSGLSGFSVMSIPSVQDELTPAVSREGSAFSLLLNALEQQTSNQHSLPTQWSNNPVDNDSRMLESRDVSTSGVAGMTQSDSYYPPQYTTAAAAAAAASGNGIYANGAGAAARGTAAYPVAVATAPAVSAGPGLHPIYTATGDVLYSTYTPAGVTASAAAPVAATSYSALGPPSLQPPQAVTYTPYYPPVAAVPAVGSAGGGSGGGGGGGMSIDTSITTLSTSYSANGFGGVNYAVQQLDTPGSVASVMTNYAYIGSGSNTPSVTHHQTAIAAAAAAAAAAASGASVPAGSSQTFGYANASTMPQANQQFNFLNVSKGGAYNNNYNSNFNQSVDEGDDKGKLDKEGRYVSRNNYRCGKCGKQKANHVCAYVDTALTNMAVQTFSPILDTYHMAIFAGDKILTVSKRKNIHDTFDYAGHHNKFNFNQYRPFNPATYMPHLTASPLPPGTRPVPHHGTQLYSRLPFTYDMVLEQLRLVAMQQQQAATAATSGLPPMPANYYGTGPSAPVVCQPVTGGGAGAAGAGAGHYVAATKANTIATSTSNTATNATTATVSTMNSVNKSSSVVPQLNTTRGSEMAVSTTSIDSELSLF